MIGLLIALGAGLFTLVGSFFVIFHKKKEKFINFSISIAFSSLVILTVIEIIPEALEHFLEDYSKFNSFLLLFGIALIGVGIMKIIDKFIPTHTHDHHDTEKDDHEHNNNLLHIGIVSSIVLLIHNIIEGMALYSSYLTSTSMAVTMMIGIGLHNIPLGMIITSTFYNSNKDFKKTLLINILVSVSTLVGAIIMFVLNNSFDSPFMIGILLSVTTGLIIYILFFELLEKVLKTFKTKETKFGLLCGIIVLIISSFI